ncbi:aspartate/glutamate racemase family protein [Georgenia sp. H159]|uniref:aspartate/glutamate racemase family protein n=1 Tax=Georgenia sp. H159 TaxID=3076115 RepID=UPI002D799D64|nr:aspartate/glutamate racemase family protein [Georgenia sp. H159]
MNRPLVVGLVHTVPALAGTFEQLLTAAAPTVRTIHVADAWLLRTAIDTGVDERVHERVAEHAAHLAGSGARAVLLTCSSIGETAAGAAERAGLPVVRVDEPMAHDAVDLAVAAGRAAGRPGRVAVLATLSSTLGPTGRLVDDAVTRSGARVTVTATVVEGAAAARAAGDHAGHDARVRAAVARCAEESDVVVLAQASMAAALDGDTDGTPVLSSPSGGVGALLEAARGAP